MAMASMFEIVLLFLFGFGVALPSPLGLPPRAEDPALVRAAPADTIFYLQWFGRATADPASANATEQLAAEPEIRAFMAQLRTAIRDSLLHEAAQHPLASDALDLADVALRSPGCLFVSGGPGPEALRGGLVLNLGEHAAAASTVMRKVESMMVEQLPPAQDLPATEPVIQDGVRFRPLPMPAPVPVMWGVVDEYLVLAVGAGVPEAVVNGLRGAAGLSAHTTFTKLRSSAQVARPCFRSFIDLESIIRFAQAGLGPEFGVFRDVMGLGGVTALFTESGLEGNGYTSRSILGTSGEPTGALKLLAGKPLSDSDLAVVPDDATFASVLRCDPRQVYGVLRDAIAKLDPGSTDDFDAGVEQLEAMLGVSLEKDLLAHLGDVLSVWSAPSEGGLLVTGATASLSLSDGTAFGTVFEKVMRRLEAMAPRKQRDERGRFRRGFYLQSLEHRDSEGDNTTIYYLNMIGDDVPIAPAWCATDGHLMISLFPQMLKASLNRGRGLETSLAGRARGIDPTPAIALTYLDAENAMKTIYPLLHPLAHLAASELQRDGFDMDIGALPSQAAITRHLRPEHGALEWTESGLLLTRRGTIPLGDPVLGLTLPAAGMWMTMLRFRAAAHMAAEARAHALEIERQRRDK